MMHCPTSLLLTVREGEREGRRMRRGGGGERMKGWGGRRKEEGRERSREEGRKHGEREGRMVRRGERRKGGGRREVGYMC